MGYATPDPVWPAGPEQYCRGTMKTALDCVPCIVRQSLDASRAVSDDPAVHEQVLRDTLLWIAEAGTGGTPVELGQRLHRRLREITGVARSLPS